MGFEDRDVVAKEPRIKSAKTIEKMEISRNRDLPGEQLEILVHKRVIVGGKSHTIIGQVPQAKVDAFWRSTKVKMMKLIDDAEY